MVPDLSRRQLLAGSGVALGTGLVGTALHAPTWLPDPVTDLLVGVAPEPPEHVWRPAVSAAHADEAVEHLADVVERANDLQERVDPDAVPDDLAFQLDGGDPSGGWLETAREESDPHARLFDATYGMQFAGEVVGAGRVALDEADPAALVERGQRLQSEADDVHASLGDYPVSEPSRDLALLHFVERELGLARLDAHRSGVDAGGDADADDYADHDLVSTWGSHVQAEQRLRNARRYRDRYRERLGDDARPYADDLADALATLTDAVEEQPTRNEVREEIEDERGLTQETPYGAARWELWTLCYDDDFRYGFDPDGYRPGHTVQRVVETAWALLARRAHEFALAELDVSPGDDGYDSGRTLREKRRAVRTFRSVREEYGSPFAGVLAERAADAIRAGDIGLGSGRDDDRPAWQDRVEATTYYLVGTGWLRELGDVLGVILDGRE